MSMLYCSVCGDKVDEDNFITLGVTSPTLSLCSVDCVDEVLDSIRRAIDNHPSLPVKKEQHNG